MTKQETADVHARSLPVPSLAQACRHVAPHGGQMGMVGSGVRWLQTMIECIAGNHRGLNRRGPLAGIPRRGHLRSQITKRGQYVWVADLAVDGHPEHNVRR